MKLFSVNPQKEKRLQMPLEYYTVADVAGMLKISSTQVRRMIESDQLPAIRIAERCIRIPASRLEWLLKEKEKASEQLHTPI